MHSIFQVKAVLISGSISLVLRTIVHGRRMINLFMKEKTMKNITLANMRIGLLSQQNTKQEAAEDSPAQKWRKTWVRSVDVATTPS